MTSLQVAKDSPDLLGLLTEFRHKMKELQSHIAPVLAKVRRQQLPTNKGV